MCVDHGSSRDNCVGIVSLKKAGAGLLFQKMMARFHAIHNWSGTSKKGGSCGRLFQNGLDIYRSYHITYHFEVGPATSPMSVGPLYSIVLGGGHP